MSLQDYWTYLRSLILTKDSQSTAAEYWGNAKKQMVLEFQALFWTSWRLLTTVKMKGFLFQKEKRENEEMANI